MIFIRCCRFYTYCYDYFFNASIISIIMVIVILLTSTVVYLYYVYVHIFIYIYIRTYILFMISYLCSPPAVLEVGAGGPCHAHCDLSGE